MLWRVVVDLQRGVHARPSEPDDVVAAVVHLGHDVTHGDVLRAQIVVQEYLAANLGRKSNVGEKFSYIFGITAPFNATLNLRLIFCQFRKMLEALSLHNFLSWKALASLIRK